MWQYQDDRLQLDQLLVGESQFSLANGYLGVRGCFEEGYGHATQSIRGTYINGVYDRLPVKHPEKLYGFIEWMDKQPNLIDLQTIKIYLDGEPVDLDHGNYINYHRILDMKQGYTSRKFDYVSYTGKKAELEFKRLVSFEHKALFAQFVNVTYSGNIEVVSSLQVNVSNFTDHDDPRVGSEDISLILVKDKGVEENCLRARFCTVRSGIDLACHSVNSAVSGGVKLEGLPKQDDEAVMLSYTAKNQVTLEKFNYYMDSLRKSDPATYVKAYADKLKSVNFESLLESQKENLDAFWSNSDIVVEGNLKDQQAIRFSIYQLYQSAGRDALSNISAKGLSGEGYEGHYFWDTEIYAIPTLLVNQSQIAKCLLMYRHKHLDSARARARQLGHKRGVKFPWRTISGIECSAYDPAGTAQYHINADVAHAFIQYYLFTGDLEFMLAYGLEVLLETALLWIEMGHFDKDLFKIDGVTGPDEYTAIVNNNYYTNALAKHNLEWAHKMVGLLGEANEGAVSELVSRLGVSEEDIRQMKLAADSMYLPHSEALGIDMQDDGFLNKKEWDFENTPESHYPLLLHYHPFTLYRYQVLKQPDTVLAHLLLEEYTDEETMRRSFDYYEARTTHDSSLSECIYGIMASRVGYKDKAYTYFAESLKLDLENTHGNTKDGLHMANLAGSALSIIYGFAGLRVSDSGLQLRPWIPEGWEKICFKINYQDRQIGVTIGKELGLKLIFGEPLDINVEGKSYALNDEVFLPLTR